MRELLDTLWPMSTEFLPCPKCNELMVAPFVARSKALAHDYGGLRKGQQICSPCGWYEGKYGELLNRLWNETDYEGEQFQDRAIAAGDSVWESDELEEKREAYRLLVQEAMRREAEECRADPLVPEELPPPPPWTWLEGTGIR